MKAFKYVAITFISLIVWSLVFALVHFKAKDVVRYIANNITQSNAGTDCCKFEWDLKLQIFMYGLYAIIFLLITSALIVAWKKHKGGILVKHTLIITFIMIFPTHTFWGVASNCGGFLGCSNGYYFNIVVPLIMSINPLAVIISAFVAHKIAALYMEKNEGLKQAGETKR